MLISAYTESTKGVNKIRKRRTKTGSIRDILALSLYL